MVERMERKLATPPIDLSALVAQLRVERARATRRA